MLSRPSHGSWIMLTIFLGLQAVLVTQASASQPQNSLEKRNLLFGHGTSAAQKSSSSDKPQGPPKDPSKALPERCKLKPLTPQTWATLQLDNYLEKYPGGANITLSVNPTFSTRDLFLV